MSNIRLKLQDIDKNINKWAEMSICNQVETTRYSQNNKWAEMSISNIKLKLQDIHKK